MIDEVSQAVVRIHRGVAIFGDRSMQFIVEMRRLRQDEIPERFMVETDSVFVVTEQIAQGFKGISTIGP